MNKKLTQTFGKNLWFKNSCLNKIIYEINYLKDNQTSEPQSNRIKLGSFSKDNFKYNILMTLNRFEKAIYFGFEIESRPLAKLKDKLTKNTNFQLNTLPDSGEFHKIVSIICDKPRILF